ncbi:MAG: DUF4864 domain-containing protein [Pseudomonadota bacterium]
MRLTSLFAPLLILAVSFMAPLTARADDASTDIQSVIQSQLDAFQKNDLETAFGFASPTIQQKFGSPETFGRMVRNGYPMVWRPASREWRQLVQTDAGPVQVVLFEDSSGRLHEAGYLMQQIDGIWRINGVHVRQAPGVGT